MLHYKSRTIFVYFCFSCVGLSVVIVHHHLGHLMSMTHIFVQRETAKEMGGKGMLGQLYLCSLHMCVCIRAAFVFVFPKVLAKVLRLKQNSE